MPHAKLKAVITVIYEADPKHYNTTSPTQMAFIDQESFDNHDISITEILDWGEAVTVQITTLEGKI